MGKDLVQIGLLSRCDFGSLFAVAQILFYLGHSAVQSACLARTLDVNLDKLGASKDVALFKQQAAMAAIIHRRRVAERKEYFCPPGNMRGKAELARQWFLSSDKFWKQSERTVIVNQAARGELKYEWPPEFIKANNYKATHMRISFRKRGKAVGTIGNMTLYQE